MKTVAANDIRRDFTEIANQVKYAKQSFIVTNQNKPSVGIVPIEFLQLISIVKDAIAQDKKFAARFKDYITFINEQDIDLLEALDQQCTVNQHLAQAAKTLKGKVRDF